MQVGISLILGIYYAFAAHIIDFWDVDGMPLCHQNSKL